MRKLAALPSQLRVIGLGPAERQVLAADLCVLKYPAAGVNGFSMTQISVRG
jgi:hypothetical protein